MGGSRHTKKLRILANDPRFKYVLCLWLGLEGPHLHAWWRGLRLFLT